MRLNAINTKKENFIKKLDELIPLIKNYKSGDFNELSRICIHLNAIREYAQSSIYTDARRILSHFEEFIEYLENTYNKRIFLILKEKEVYSYTPNAIIKFLRGEGEIHGDSDLDKEKRIVLHNFIFEESATIYPEIEFAITYNFIIYPGVKSSNGNGDSFNLFIQSLKFAECDEKKLTLIESVVLAIALDFYFVISSGKMVWNGRVAIKNDLNAFRTSLGDQIIDDLISQEKWMLDQLKTRNI